MEWDSKDITKGLITAFVTWSSIKVAKMVKPAWSGAKKLASANESIEKLQRDLFITNETLDAFFKIYKLPLFINNDKLELQWVNTAWLEMTGFSDAEEAYGSGFLRAIPEEDHSRTEARSDRMKKHPSIQEGEMTFKHIKSKALIPVIYRAIPICNEKNELVKVLGLIIVK